MQFYDVIENRTSIKKFTNSPIQQDKLARMINSAMMSPSWKNNTCYKFILVDNGMEKEKLAASVINSTDDAGKAILESPMTAVIVADPSESGTVGDRQFYLVDSAIAMEHFVLAATNEGYGTCWIAALDENKVREALSIPNNYKVIAMTPIGEIAEQKQHYPKKDVRDYVFLNTWNQGYTNSQSDKVNDFSGIH